MTGLQPYTTAELDDLIAEFELLVIEELESSARSVSATLGAVVDRVITAAAGPPGEPFTSTEDLGALRGFWVTAVGQRLVPWLRKVFTGAAGRALSDLLRRLPEAPVERLPRVSNPLAEAHLAGAVNRLARVGDDLWFEARMQLLEGFAAGETIEQLRERVEHGAELTVNRARVVARTEVVSAANAGSVAQVRLFGMMGVKEWIATNDARTRETHRHADGQTVSLGERFRVGGALLDYPGDPTGPPDEIIQCRCTVGFDLDEDVLTADGGSEAFHLPTKHNQASHGKKGLGKLKPLKMTHGLIHKKHAPNTVIAQDEDGKWRVRWDGKNYQIETKNQKDEWKSYEEVKKSKLYQALKEYDNEWFEPGDEDDGDDQVDTPETKPEPEQKSTPEPEDELPEWEKALLEEPESAKSKKVAPPTKMEGYKKIGSQKGSNPGGLYEDENGERWYVKASHTETHARNEALAAKLYEVAGVKVPQVELLDLNGNFGDKKIGVRSKIVEGTPNLKTKMADSAYRQQVYESFAVDAWLANWDAVGLEYDNIITDKNGDPVRVDAGGSLLFRAQGGYKGDKFGNTVGEIDTLRDPKKNPQAAAMFFGVNTDDIRAGVKRIEAITPEQIDEIVDSAGFGSIHTKTLKSRLKARREDLIARFGSPEAQSKTVKSPPVVPKIPIIPTPPVEVGPKKLTGQQKAEVLETFSKNGVKWYSDTKKIYDSAQEVSQANPELTMSDALDVMDQSLKKKTGNPFRTKVEKFLATKAGKNYAISKGGSASLGDTKPVQVQSAPQIDTATDLQLRKLAHAEAVELQKRMHLEAGRKGLPLAAKQAVKSYTGSDYMQINQCMRQVSPCPEWVKNLIANMREAFTPSPEHVLLHRSTFSGNLGVKSPQDFQNMIGKTVTDKGFVSTSIRPFQWSGNVKLEIEAPKGTPMVYVATISYHQSEQEMILANGLKYRVISVTPLGNEQYRVRLRVVP